MACGCGKAKMARPASSTTTTASRVASNAQVSANARVVPADSPYAKNIAPPHLQNQRRTV